MGELGNSVQNMQLHEGGQDSRRGKYEIMAALERNINKYLFSCYLTKDLVLGPNDIVRYGIDPHIFKMVYGEFREVHVGEDMVRVVY